MTTLKLDELFEGVARKVEVDGTPVCVVRIGGDVFAVADTCSHANFSLADGEVWADECEIECPKHGALFDLRTGEPRTLPATVPVATYAVAIDGDEVEVKAR